MDFWERQRQKQQAEVKEWSKPMELSGSGQPWWRASPAQPQPEPQRPAQSRTDGNLIDGHDVSKASILRGDAEECPRCPIDPKTGIRGNMYRPTKSSAIRCFDCGYIDGRDFGEGQSRIATVEGKTQHAKQTQSGGSSGSNFRGNITSVTEAVGRIS